MAKKMFRSLAEARGTLADAGVNAGQFEGILIPPDVTEPIDALAKWLHVMCMDYHDWREQLGTYLALCGLDPMVFGYKLAGRSHAFRFEQKLWMDTRSPVVRRKKYRYDEDWVPLRIELVTDEPDMEGAFDVHDRVLVLDAGEGRIFETVGRLPEDAVRDALKMRRAAAMRAARGH